MKIRNSIFLVALAALPTLIPSAARAETVVGGGTASAGGCDVTLPSVTFDDEGSVKRVRPGGVECPPIQGR